MRFDAPLWWLMVPGLAVYLAWLSRRSYAQLSRAAQLASLLARGAVVLLLVAAVSQPIYSHRSKRHTSVFLLDVSQSVSRENLEAAIEDIDHLAREAARSGHTQVNLVAFGEGAKRLYGPAENWEGWSPDLRERVLYQTSLPSLYAERTSLISADDTGKEDKLQDVERRIEAVEQFRDHVVGEHTDIEAGMRLALGCGATDRARTVYLFTDGHFNRGAWQEAYAAAEAESVAVHTVRLDKPLPSEVAATELRMPARVRVNQGFSAELRLASNVETACKLRLYKDRYLIEERDVRVRAGQNIFPFSGLYFREKGFHTVEATLRAAQDTRLENNRVRSLVVVPGEARVLYVDRDEDQIPYLQSALELEGIQVEARPATGVPQTISELLSFDAFILCNVPADRLSLRQMQMVRSYVQDFGGGFIMLGGEESFGLGGYFNTPIEEILPVRVEIQKDITRPSLAIILVIDKSGSMSGVKIQLAKQAAVATAEVINPRDQIGVVAFDGTSRIILELTPAADRATVASHIASLDAGGGTFLYPAMEDAYRMLQESNARRKHVIILSDGQTQGFGYEELAQTMAVEGMTISTVGIGEGADMKLMEAIAMAGGGKAYFTNDFYSIPQIFTREAMRASGSMLVERLVQPVAVAHDVCLREIDVDELPLLTGYVATTSKELARTLIVSDAGDPLLAKWRYGLGRTAAYTSEPKPRWAEDWLAWPDFAKFWSQLVRSVTGNEVGQNVTIESSHSLRETGAVLAADVRDATGNFLSDVSVELSAADETGRVRPLVVQQRGPGLFEAHLPRIVYGQDQQFVWKLCSGDQTEQTKPYGFVFSFSPEYRTLTIAEETFEQVSQRRLGKVMSIGQIEFAPNDRAEVELVVLWPYFLSIALLLVPIDILLRRMG